MKPLMETEQRNPLSYRIDSKSTLEILDIINAEDKKVPFAVEAAIPRIATIVDDVVASSNRGGRLFYIGAGSPGRLGVSPHLRGGPFDGAGHHCRRPESPHHFSGVG
ncbi:MAG TPA: hypothetical protein VJ854_04740 [Sphaerochaeta sp.]|nr:hypothetical protein [Sphaerochaeta sp.]